MNKKTGIKPNDLCLLLISLVLLLGYGKCYSQNGAAMSRDPFRPQRSLAKNSFSNHVMNYNINELKLLGVMEMYNKFWGVVLTPAGDIFQLTVGDTLGTQNAVIKNITLNSMDLEIKSDDIHSPLVQQKLLLP